MVRLLVLHRRSSKDDEPTTSLMDCPAAAADKLCHSLCLWLLWPLCYVLFLMDPTKRRDTASSSTATTTEGYYTKQAMIWMICTFAFVDEWTLWSELETLWRSSLCSLLNV